jgi:hypothetical protein
MDMSLPKFEFTEEEALEYLTTGRILNNARLVLKVKWDYLEDRRHNKEWPTIKRLVEMARKYRTRLPKEVKDQLSEWRKYVLGKMKHRADMHVKEFEMHRNAHRTMEPLRKLPDDAFATWEDLISHKLYRQFCKRWAVLAIDSAEKHYRRLGLPIPKIEVEVVDVQTQGMCGVGYSKGYPTIYLQRPNYRGFGLNRWNGHVSIGRSPEYSPVYLEVRKIGGEYRLIPVVNAHEMPINHKWLYSFAGVTDWEVRTRYEEGYRLYPETQPLANNEIVDVLYGVNGTETPKKFLLFSNK